MSDRGGGKWMPYDLNGSVHECKTNSNSSSKSTWTKKVEAKPLSLEELDARVKKLEAVIFAGVDKK